MHLIKTKYITQPHHDLAEVSIKLYNAEVFGVELVTKVFFPRT